MADGGVSRLKNVVKVPDLRGKILFTILVILIYRDDAYNRDPNNPEAGTAELIVAKQRNGPTGVVRLAFLREQTRFASLAPGA